MCVRGPSIVSTGAESTTRKGLKGFFSGVKKDIYRGAYVYVHLFILLRDWSSESRVGYSVPCMVRNRAPQSRLDCHPGAPGSTVPFILRLEQPVATLVTLLIHVHVFLPSTQILREHSSSVDCVTDHRCHVGRFQARRPTA